MTGMTAKKFMDYEATKWYCLAELPSVNSKAGRSFADARNGTSGVYQFAQRSDISKILSTDLINKKIGYTGKSKNILDRTVAARMKGCHGVNRVILENKWSTEDIYVRYLFVPEDESAELESYIHKEAEKEFGTRFAWMNASGGNAGKFSQIQDLADALTLEECFEMIIYFKDLARGKGVEEIERRLGEL
jgi:hypothetical protein